MSRPHRNDPISKYMTADPICIEADAEIEEAMAIMEETGVRHLPVLKDGYLVGIITDRDIVQSFATSPQIYKVEAAMTRDPFSVTSDTCLDRVLQVLHSNKIGCVVVRDPGEKVSGIFTVTDVTSLLLRSLI